MSIFPFEIELNASIVGVLIAVLFFFGIPAALWLVSPAHGKGFGLLVGTIVSVLAGLLFYFIVLVILFKNGHTTQGLLVLLIPLPTYIFLWITTRFIDGDPAPLTAIVVSLLITIYTSIWWEHKGDKRSFWIFGLLIEVVQSDTSQLENTKSQRSFAISANKLKTSLEFETKIKTDV